MHERGWTVECCIITLYAIHKYCGVFTPYKNCNIETRSRDYATVEEAVFSPCRAEQSRAVNESLIASNRLASLLPGNSYKHLDDARVGKGHVTALATMQQLKRFPACQIQGFIGVRSSSSQQFSSKRGEFQTADDEFTYYIWRLRM
jgi:hypothetical protein